MKSHPFARIFKEHYSLLQPCDEIRVLGLAKQLMGIERTTTYRLRKIKIIERLMHSKKVDFVLLDEKKRMNIMSLGDSSERKKEEEELPTRTDDEV